MVSTYCDALMEKLTPLLAAASGRPVLVGLDGCCGSGKTTLAGQLAQRLPECTVLHTDDYYLPLDRRAPDWMHTPAANIVPWPGCGQKCWTLPGQGSPLQSGLTAAVRGGYLPPEERIPGAVVLVEGSYSHHPALADCYDLRIFLRCSPAEQARRLQAREGERYPLFVQR